MNLALATDLGTWLFATWIAVLSHLWQTTLVLTVLFLLARGLGRAPAWLADRFWTVALVKLVLPVGVLGGVTTGWLRRWTESASPASEATRPVLSTVGTVLDTTDHLQVEALGQSAWGLGFLLVLTVLWQLGFLWVVVRACQELAWSRHQAGIRVSALAEPVGRRLLAALGRAGISRAVVQISDEVAMPLVVGLIRPRILIPARVVNELPVAELAAVLRHEEAHRRRRDPLRALLQRVTLSLFFFYPLLHPILARLTEAAECVCDEEALRTGIAPDRYARALARVTLLAGAPGHAVAAIGSGGPSLLRKRLARLGEKERKTMPHARIIVLAAVLLVALGSLLPLSLSAESSQSVEVVSVETIPPPPPRADAIPAEPGEPGEPAEPAAEPVPQEIPVPTAEPVPVAPPTLAPAPAHVETLVPSAAPASPAPAAPASAPLAAPAPAAAPVQATAPAAPARDPEPASDQPLPPEASGENLIVAPELIRFVQPKYPESARQAKARGAVVLEILVNEEGEVAESKVTQGVDGYPELGEAALTASRDFGFEPGTENGNPTQMWVSLTVKFQLK